MLYVLTLDEMKDALGIKDVEDDSRVTRLLEGLQGRAAQYCHRTFLYSSGIEEFFDGDQQWLLVKSCPIDTVASVQVSDAALWDGTTLLDPSLYRINKARGRLMYGDGAHSYFQTQHNWPRGSQNIRVVYAGGLLNADGSAAPNADSDDIDALRRGMHIQANFEWRNRQNLGQQAVSAQGVNVTLARAELLPEVKQIFDQLKRF